jgi:hypothetical protein
MNSLPSDVNTHVPVTVFQISSLLPQNPDIFTVPSGPLDADYIFTTDLSIIQFILFA